MIESMFEIFSVPSLRLVPDCVLALAGRGLKTGLVPDSGFESTCVAAVVEVADRKTSEQAKKTTTKPPPNSNENISTFSAPVAHV